MRMIFTVIIVFAFIVFAWWMISPWFKKIGGAVKDAHEDLKENLSDDDDDDIEDEHDKYASSERAIAPHTRSQHSFTSSTRTRAQQEEIDRKAGEEAHARLTREWAQQAKQRLEKQRLEKQRLEEARKRRQREEKDRQNMTNDYPYIGNPTWGQYVSEDDSSRHHSHSSHHDSGSSDSSSYDSGSSSYDSGSSGSSDSSSW